MTTGDSKLSLLGRERESWYEVRMKIKEVLSLLWAELFEGWGNGNNKTGTVRRQRGSFFLRGREPEFVLK